MYLRPYRASDLDALFALDVICFEPRYRFSHQLMEAVLSAPNAVVCVACTNGQGKAEQILGFGAVSLETDEVPFGYVATLDVAPEHRGQGIGRSLLLALEAELLAKDVHRIMLHVAVENVSAVGLYEKLGYLKLGRERGFYGAHFDAWWYSKELSPT